MTNPPAADWPARRPKGITCPACAIRLHTRRVIPLADGSVRRVKRCGQCGYRCSSYERIAGSQSR